MATRNTHTVNRAKDQGSQSARRAANSRWVGILTRLGFAARGIVYGLVGILAIQVAIGGSGGQITNQQGALNTIAQQPGGRILLIVVAVGLAGYALWGLIRAALDPLHKGNDTKGTIARLGYLVSGISYGALCYAAVQLIMRHSGGQGGSTGQGAASSLLAKSWGPWVIGAIGLAIIGAAIAQISQGWQANFDMHFNNYAMSAEQRRQATRLGRFGYIARGIVFAIVGLFLVQAALYRDPSRVVGIDGALQALARQPYGTILLGIVAAGLIAFGIYSLLGAAWFRLKNV
jgi:hypothetical protein